MSDLLHSGGQTPKLTPEGSGENRGKVDPMTINLQKPDITELKPRITVFGVGGGGGNAVNNMITAGMEGVEFVVANTDAQALSMSKAERIIQLGAAVTEGLGAGSQPEIGRAAAEECLDEILDHLNGTHMCFVTAGMGGGTGTGAAPVVARAARERGILTVGVVTKPFQFEGGRRMRTADAGIEELQANVDTLIVIPNQNLFRIANDKTTFADAFGMADQVLYSGVACITDLMVKEGLINLDFADVRSVMRDMGKAMMGTGEASGEGRAMAAAEAAISNPLLDETSMMGADGLLISITGGRDMTLYEVDEAATRIREEVDPDANIILGATFDEAMEGLIRVSVVATGIDSSGKREIAPRQPLQAQQPLRQAPIQKPTVTPAPKPEMAAPRQAPLQATAQVTAPIAAKPLATPQVPVAADPVADLIQDDADWQAQPVQSRPASPAFTPKSSVFANARPAASVHSAPAAYEDDIEPTLEVAPRMPRIEEFPEQAQAEYARAQAPLVQTEEERSAVGLLRRLTHGLSRRDEDVAAQAAPREPALRPAQRPAGAAGSLDPHGRRAPAAPQMDEDDQLEIPAFLRRQVS